MIKQEQFILPKMKPENLQVPPSKCVSYPSPN